MGFFAKAVGSIVPDLIGLGLDIIGSGKQKKAITRAGAQEQEQFQAGVDESRAFVDTSRTDVAPQLQAGQTASERLISLFTGGDTPAPTRAETFATERALETINQQSSVGGNLLSGKRLVRAGEVAADIGSTFRQQDLINLLNVSGQGLTAAGQSQTAGRFGTANIVDLLRDTGASRAGVTLGKNEATQRLLESIGKASGSIFEKVQKAAIPIPTG